MALQANHFPGTWQLGRKDKLYTNLARAKRMRGTFFDVIPKFYILPRDRQELKQYAAAHPDQLYIQKVSTTVPEIYCKRCTGSCSCSIAWLIWWVVMQVSTHDAAAKVHAFAVLAS